MCFRNDGLFSLRIVFNCAKIMKDCFEGLSTSFCACSVTSGVWVVPVFVYVAKVLSAGRKSCVRIEGNVAPGVSNTQSRVPPALPTLTPAQLGYCVPCPDKSRDLYGTSLSTPNMNGRCLNPSPRLGYRDTNCLNGLDSFNAWDADVLLLLPVFLLSCPRTLSSYM